MVFIIFCVMLVISVAQIGALPIVDEIKNGTASADKIYKTYKLPQVITPFSFAMTVNGTATDENTTVTILVADPEYEDVCCIVINFGEKVLKVSPAQYEEDALPIHFSKSMEFSVKISARDDFGVDLLGVTFGGGNDPVYCRINDFNNISHITFKGGVKNVQNMLFEYIINKYEKTG